MAIPNQRKGDYLKGTLDYSSGGDTYRVMLLDDSSTYSFDADSHDHVDDITSAGNEMSGTGYSRKSLSNQAVTVDDTNDQAEWDADDVTFTGLDAGTIQTIVVYRQVGGDDSTPADDEVVAVYDDDSGNAQPSDLPLTTNGGDVTLSWNSEGLLKIT